MSFSLFLAGTRGHSIIFFYQHHGYVVLYIPPLELFELIEWWHFAVALCDANAVGEIAKGITLKVFTPASSVRGRRLAGGGGAPLGRPHDCRRDDILSIFTCEYGWVQAAHRSVVFCACTCCQMSAATYKVAFFFGLVPPLFHPISLYLSHGRRVKLTIRRYHIKNALPTF